MIKILSKLGIERDFNLLKNICKNFIGAIILNGEKPGEFPLRSDTKQRYSLSPFFQHCIVSPSLFNKTGKGNKRCIYWEGRNTTVLVCR